MKPEFFTKKNNRLLALPRLGILLGIVLFLSCVTTGMTPQELAREFYNLGNAYYDLKKYKEASQFYAKALELDKSLNQASYNLTRALAESGDYDRAVKNLEELSLLDPGNLLIKKTMGYIRFFQGNKEESLRLYEEVLQSTPLDADTLFNAGYAAYELKQDEKALRHLEAFQAQGHNEADLLKLVSDLYQRTGQSVKAIPVLETLTTLEPSNRLWWLNLADIQEDQEHYDKAMEALGKLENLGPAKDGKPDTALLFRMGRIYITKIQDFNKASEYFTKAAVAGFSDQEQIKELLATKDLFQRARVEALFKEKRLLKDPQAKDEAAVPPSALRDGQTAPKQNETKPLEESKP